ncbi:unnamed protein product [Rhizoctonia solani]|uniref:F-box domain-containing protein n=1 Tax=Rhizoctonia solani TaxID=456999 RepID=A0A8H3CYX9_9AGAM|nr:unnamed protein product [Rhizoctonia solani]
MAVFLDLPPECIAHIFLFLIPRQIATCGLVCRPFWTITNDSLELQYLLELDRLGLVSPPTSSSKLPLHEKVSILREKRLRANAPDISAGASGMMNIYLNSEDHGNIIVEYHRSYTFSRGVFAFQGEDWPNQLGIYQFSSQNRDIGHSHYMLDCPPENWMMAVEPSFDLLALYGKAGGGPVFHLRSLRTGLPHPAALCPTIFCSSPTGIRISHFPTISVEIVGRRIVHMREISERCSSLVTIWDWVTGQIVTSTKVLGYSFAFLSEDIFLVPTPGHATPDGDSHPLALYTCSGVPSGGPARLIARFQFPISDTIRMNFAIFEPSPLPPAWDCPTPLVSPPRIYATSSTLHYLALKIGFPLKTVMGSW